MLGARNLALLSVAACLFLPACGSNSVPAKPDGVQVSGKVLLANGSPLAGGTLVLRPVNGVYGATAQIRPDGSFTLEDAGADKIVEGSYQVFVRFGDSNQAELSKQVAARYQESSEDVDSDVIVNIAGDTTDLAIKLKK